MQKLDPKLIEPIDKIASIVRKEIVGNITNNVNLFKMVQKSGVELFGMVDEEYDGVSMLNPNTKKPQIYLDINQSEQRRRFTLAHELGHLVLDYNWFPGKEIQLNHEKEVLSVNFRYKDRQEDTTEISEQIANEFAAAFLMPTKLVKQIIEGADEDDEKIEMVAENFGVSKLSAKNRLEVIGEIDAA